MSPGPCQGLVGDAERLDNSLAWVGTIHLLKQNKNAPEKGSCKSLETSLYVQAMLLQYQPSRDHIMLESV